MIAVILVGFAIHEWLRSYFDTPPSPIIYSLIAAAAVAICAYKIKKHLQKIRHIKLGRDGEKCVGQFLDLLRESGAKVFHDVPALGFNLDHVVLSEYGIFVIETKTYSKPDGGAAKIEFDGKNITKNGYPLERDPIVQVTAAAKYIKEQLLDSTGKSFPIRPVVTFPGWFVTTKKGNTNSDVWVLNPKALPAFISNSNTIMPTEDIHLANYHLSRYIRTFR